MLRTIIERIAFSVVATVAVVSSVIVGMERPKADVGSLKGRALRCAIQTHGSKHHLPGLTVGYNYELLQRFAADLGDSVAFIANARPGSSWLDSLRRGRVDIVVLPYRDSIPADSVFFSQPIDSLTVWAVRNDSKAAMKEVDDWIGAFLSSEGHEDLRDLYLLRYSPSRRSGWGRTVKAISPYDSLVKAGAETLGWDWHLLCAVIYSESQFHIEFRSRRGAEGLFQMMPSTAAKMGVQDLFSPSENLKAGVAYLKYLQRMFRSKAADGDELLKFTLAAFNAGEGRMLDVYNFAMSVGADADTWEGLVSVIPQMTEETAVQMDSILKLGPFEGTETIRYVDKVLSLYEDFKRIGP